MHTPSFSPFFKRLMLAGAVAGLAAAAQAQPAGAGASPRHDPAQMQQRMQERMQERMARLKAELKITPEQEAAWNSFTASMKPPARPAPPDREEIRKLNTPERIERMRAERARRGQAMDQREQATLQFYAALTPEQQKVFDARLPPAAHGPLHTPRGHGPHGTPPAKG